MRTCSLICPAVLMLLGPTPGATAAPDPEEVRATIRKGVEYLKTVQKPDGSFAPEVVGPGVSALTAVALLRSGHGLDDPMLAKTMDYLETFVKPDGGIYGRGLANYTTSLGLVAFSLANTDGRYDAVVAGAVKFLKRLQTAEDPNDPLYGGVTYGGGGGGADLSNTQYFLEALAEAGVPKDDPAFQRAMTFLGRCQNLPGEHNQLEFARKAADEDRGGFAYSPTGADDPDSPRRTPEGGLRSEGGMTYAGLKSFLYAGVGKDDPRVKAAVDWARRHYTLEQNPGMGTAGLYYYYHTFAKAMSAYGENPFADAEGTEHDWKDELFRTLKTAQREDGSWANTNKAYLETLPELATAFAILSLSYTLPQGE